MSQVSTNPTECSDAVVVRSDAQTPSRRADYAELCKLRISLMVAITTFVGFAFGLPLGFGVGGWSVWTLLATLAGTTLACMGSGVLNQVYERRSDALMQRTADRPLPAGRIGSWEAMALGVVLAVAGCVLLWFEANPLSAMLCAFTIFSYTHVYTPLKQVHWLSTHIGAIPGAMPPVIGYAAAAGRLDWEAAALFAIMFIWQVPHFLAIAYLYRDDYARAGIPMLPVIEPDGRRTFRQILATCVVLLGAGAAPLLLGMTGYASLVVATLLGLWFLWLAIKLIQSGKRDDARKLFLASLVYLPVVFAAMMLDRVW